MSFDHRAAQHAPTTGAAAAGSAMIPGKPALIDGLVMQRRESASLHDARSACAAPGATGDRCMDLMRLQ